MVHRGPEREVAEKHHYDFVPYFLSLLPNVCSGGHFFADESVLQKRCCRTLSKGAVGAESESLPYQHWSLGVGS